MTDFLLEQASTTAGDVDALWWFLCVITGTVCFLVAGAVLFFTIRYHRQRETEIGYPITGSIPARRCSPMAWPASGASSRKVGRACSW